MNNKNKILIVCLALLLALSVGYALFSDTITINGTATAKGSFDITATCEPGIASKLGTAESLGLAAEGGYENDTCVVSKDDVVSMSTEFLYPGARRHYTIKFTNTGTIDAYLAGSKATDTDQICVADNIEGENKECKTQQNTLSALVLNNYTADALSELIGMEDPDGNLLTQSEMTEFLNNTVILKPGYSFYIYATLYVEHKNQSAQYDAGEMFVEFNVEAFWPFEQATN